MRRTLAAVAAMLIALPALAADIPHTVGEPYSQARSEMMSEGFSPTAAERACGVGREDVCDAYAETEACSGTGRAFCAFRFVGADGQAVRIVTTGETVETLVVHDAFAVAND